MTRRRQIVTGDDISYRDTSGVRPIDLHDLLARPRALAVLAAMRQRRFPFNAQAFAKAADLCSGDAARNLAEIMQEWGLIEVERLSGSTFEARLTALGRRMSAHVAAILRTLRLSPAKYVGAALVRSLTAERDRKKPLE